ncbi:MAG: hypothetical protein IJY48_01840 [Mailhella sp.]|nr:hypothetical protein [Mailhella sp.]
MDSMNHNDKALEHSPQADAPEKKNSSQSEKSRVRKVLRWTAFGMAGLLGLVTVSAGGGLLFLRSDSGERWLTSVINNTMTTLPSGLSGHIDAFHGPLPEAMHIEGLSLKDKNGEWLTARRATLRLDWGALPEAFVIAEISADEPVFLRTPEMEPNPEPDTPPAPSASPQEMLSQLETFLKDWPSWLPEIRVDELALRSAEVKSGPYPFKAGMQASASAGRAGLAAKADIVREDGSLPADAPNRHTSLAVELSPERDFLLDARLSDMGFASAFLPADMASQPAFELTLKGKAPILKWAASLEGALRDDAAKGGTPSANTILAFAGNIGLRPLAQTPGADVALNVDSGALASRFWRVAGQIDGQLSLKLNANAEAGAESRASAALDIALEKMQWGTPLLESLMGQKASAGTSADLYIGADGGLKASLEKLYARAAHLEAEASGSVNLAKGDIAQADSRADLKAAFSLNNAAHLSPELSGDLIADAELSGSFHELGAKLNLKSAHLDTSAAKIQDMDVKVHVPSVDIVTLAGLRDSVKKTGKADILNGSAQASLTLNEQPIRLSSNWLAEDGGSALRFLLDALDMQVGNNNIMGHLTAALAKKPGAFAKDSVAEKLGVPLPSLDGELKVSIPDWESISALSGLAMSGEPLQADLSLANSGGQNLALAFDLPAFKTYAAEQDIEISGLHADIKAEDIWGRPAAAVLTAFSEAEIGKMSLGETTARVVGGMDALNVAVQSKGGIESDIKAQWKPGEVHIGVLDARIQPAQLGLPDGPAVGLTLSSPTTVSYAGDSVSVSDVSLALLPAGKLSASGKFAPNDLKGRLSLSDIALESYQHLVRGIPSGRVDLQADFAGRPQAPTGNLKLNLKDIVISGSALPPMDSEMRGSLAMSGKRRALRVQMDIPEKTQRALGLTRFLCKAEVPFTSPSSGMSMPDMKGPLSAQLSLGGQIEGLWKLVPSADQRLSGIVDIDVSASGPMTSPLVTAHASVKDGAFLEIMQGG